MSHQKSCRVCGTYSTSRWRTEDSAWKFKGYHWVPKKRDLSKLVCNGCYGALKKTGPALQPAPPPQPSLEQLAEAALEERASLSLACWPYQDDIEQMTAEAHAWRLWPDHNLRVQAMTYGCDFQEHYERNRPPYKKVP
jgi:hypothetical protein